MMSAPLARTSSGRIALTVAAVPTGMKAGVRISPRSMAIVPVRADPSVAVISKEKRGIGGGLSGFRTYSSRSGLTRQQKAGVSVAIEPVTLLDRVRIG